MNIQSFFRRLARQARGEALLSDETLARMMTRLQEIGKRELSCREVFAIVDEYAEASQRGEDVASLKPFIRLHLDLCRECEEEYQALLRVLEGVASKEAEAFSVNKS